MISVQVMHLLGYDEDLTVFIKRLQSDSRFHNHTQVRVELSIKHSRNVILVAIIHYYFYSYIICTICFINPHLVLFNLRRSLMKNSTVYSSINRLYSNTYI